MNQAEWAPDHTESEAESEAADALRPLPGPPEHALRMNRPDRAPNLTAPAPWRPALNLPPYTLSPQTLPPGPTAFLPPSSVPNMYMNLPGFHPPLMLSGLPPGEALFKPPLRFPAANPYLSLPGREPFFNASVDPRFFLGRQSPPFPRKLSPVVPGKAPPAFLNGPCPPFSCPSPSPAAQLPWSAEEVSSGTYRYHLPDRKALSFRKGTLIRMAGPGCKRVEELSTTDFVQSADRHPEYNLETSVVVQIEENHAKDTARLEFAVGTRKDKVIMEVSVVQPFFVVHQGWASCDPPRTLDKLKLECHQLRPGDLCFTLASNSALPTGAASGPRLFPEPPPPPLPPPPPTTTKPPPPPLHIPIPDPPVDVETVGDAEGEVGGGKFFKKARRWPWDSNSPPE